MNPRIASIIEEGAKTFSISRITSEEKEVIATLYQDVTGEPLNIYCGGCIVGACIAIHKNLNKSRV